MYLYSKGTSKSLTSSMCALSRKKSAVSIVFEDTVANWKAIV